MVIPLFDRIMDSPIEVAGVLTNPPRARGRSSQALPSPVSIWGRERGLPVFESDKLDECAELIASVDLIFVVAYGRLIKKALLTLPRIGWVNLHFSSLPEARGAAPVQRLIAEGVQRIGYTLFQLDEGMDTGPIYFRSDEIDIAEMTTGEVWSKLVDTAAKDIVSHLQEIANGLKPQKQSVYQGSLPTAPKISSAEAEINWQESAEKIVRQIRAFNPAPSSWTHFRNERLLIHRSKAVPQLSGRVLTPGEIFSGNSRVLVGTGEGELLLEEVQASGKRRMSAVEWIRGIKLQDGERCE